MIDNTTKQVQDNPSAFLLAGMVMGASGAIEAQEAQGQAQLVNSKLLPTQIDKASKEALERAGVVFGAGVEGDDLFCHATLPAGWKKVGTDHSMWSKLLDAKGRERASIFYKAAFYDRKAHMRASTRYSWETVYDEDYSLEKLRPVNILDGKEVIHSFAPMDYDSRNRIPEAWLNERYPDWRNPSAYWEETL